VKRFTKIKKKGYRAEGHYKLMLINEKWAKFMGNLSHSPSLS
jgi:hypothetical protein